MKKMLSILSSFLIVSSTTLTIVACENMVNTPGPDKPYPEKPDPELPIIRTIDHEDYKVYE
ncbi:lipoprotein [Spiroplasma endosymbiont of Anurida maritima]|uniref:lipoprotein n=1 Tax=Spiroplasma endosymbiont of Anurida maritima TaxID=2967972 RepID=UPI0036D33F82